MQFISAACRKAANIWRGSERHQPRAQPTILERIEPMMMSSDLAPYSLVGTAMAYLLQKIEIVGTSSNVGTYELALSGNSEPAVAWNGIKGVRATFAGNILVTQNDFTVRGSLWSNYDGENPETGGNYASSNFTRTYDANTNTTTAEWTIPGLDPTTNTLLGDVFGLEFHSSIHAPNSGAIGGGYVIPLAVLAGDLNHDGVVGADDETAFNSIYSANLGQSHTSFVASDLNLDGTTSAADLAMFNAARSAGAQQPSFNSLSQNPMAPYDLKAEATGKTSIKISWKNSSAAGVELQQSTVGLQSWSTVASLPVGATSYERKGLLEGRGFSFRLAVTDGHGNLITSAPVSASTSATALEQSALGSALREVALMPPTPAVGEDGHDAFVLGFGTTTTLPWTNLNRIRATFAGDMAVAQEDMTIRGVQIDVHSITTFERSYDEETGLTTAIWTVPTLNVLHSEIGSGKGEKFILQFHNTIHSTSGQSLTGSDFYLNFKVLAGDVGRNGTVTSADTSTFNSNYSANAFVSSFDRYDLNLDGQLTSADQSIVSSGVGNNSLPTAEPVHAPSAPWAFTAAESGGKVKIQWLAENAADRVLIQRAPGDVSNSSSAFETIATIDASSPGQWLTTPGEFVDDALLLGTSFTYRIVAVDSSDELSVPSRPIHLDVAQSLAASALGGVLESVEVLKNANDSAGHAIAISNSSNPALPWSALSAVRATFNGNVRVGKDDLNIVGGDLGNYTATAFVRTYDAELDKTFATWTIPALSGAGKSENLALQFHNSIVRGGSLPKSGQDFILPVTILAGDVNGDRIVDSADAADFASHYTENASAAAFSRYDINLDGVLTAADEDAVENESELPAEAPLVMQSAPDAPTVTITGHDSVQLRWNNNGNPEKVRVYRAAPSGGFSQIAELTPASNQTEMTYTDDELDAGAAYIYKLVGVFEGGALSHPSAVTLASTGSDALDASALRGIVASISLLPDHEQIGGYPLGIGSNVAAAPWAGISRIRAVFNGAIAVNADDLIVSGVVQAVHPVTGFTRTYDADKDMTVATWTVPTLDPLISENNGEKFAIQLHNSICAFGKPLPAGTDLVIRFDSLLADVTGNGIANGGDSDDFASTFVSGPAGDFSRTDLNLDGTLSSADEDLMDAGNPGALPAGAPAIHLHAPSGLVAQAIGSDSIVLTWQSADETSRVRIERAILPRGEFEELAQLDAGSESFVDQTVDAATAYVYRLVSVPQSGADSHPSALITVATSSPALSQSALDGLLKNVELVPADEAMGGFALGLGDNSATLPWHGLSRVRATFAGNVIVAQADLEVYGVRYPSYPTTGFSRVYDAQSNTTFAIWNIEGLATTIGDKIALQFHNSIASAETGLAAGMDMIVRFNLLPGDIDGDGEITSSDALTTSPETFVRAFSIQDINLDGRITQADESAIDSQLEETLPSGAPVVKPSAPSGLRATITSTGGVAIQWSSQSGTSTIVQRSVDPSQGFETIATIAGGTTTFSESQSALLQRRFFVYRLIAVDGEGTQSNISAPLSVDSSMALGQSALAGILDKVELMTPDEEFGAYTISLGPDVDFTLPWLTISGNNLNRIRATFSGNVTITNDDLRVLGVDDSDTVQYEVTLESGYPSYDAQTDKTTVIWSVDPLGGSGHANMALQFSNAIQPVEGLKRSGTDFVIPFRVLSADIDGNGIADGRDATLFLGAYQDGASVDPFSRNDIALDGQINVNDSLLLSSGMGGSLPSDTPLLRPIAPSSLQAGPADGGGVVLRWSPNNQPPNVSVDGYKIERSTDGGPFELLNTELISAAATGYTDSTAANNEDYVYRVIAVDGGNDSAPSVRVSVTTSAGSLTVTIDSDSETSATLHGTEGEALTLSGELSEVTPGTWSVVIDWDDGNIETIPGNDDGTFSAEHTYDDNTAGGYAASVQVVSSWGQGDTQSVDITIDNAPPTGELKITGATTAFSAATIAIENINDPSDADTADGLDYRFDLNNDGVFEVGSEASNLSTITHAFTSPGLYIVRAKISDKDGGSTNLSQAIIVNSGGFVVTGPDMALVSPVQVHAPATESPQTADEGEEMEFELGSFSDPIANAGPYSVAVDWGDGIAVENFTVSGTNGSLGARPHTYDDNGTYQVNVRVTNAIDAFESTTFSVVVDNVGPDESDSYLEAVPKLGEGYVFYQGLPVVLTVQGAEDVSSADVNAGFEYSFKFGSSTSEEYSPWQASPTIIYVPQSSDGNISWKIRDKDGGISGVQSDYIDIEEPPTGFWNPNQFAEGDITPGYGYTYGDVISINNMDQDHDGVPGFADGYNWNESEPAADSPDDASSDVYFYPIKFTLPSETAFNQIVSFKIDYSASDPNDVTIDSDGVYHLPTGAARLWTGTAAHGFARRTAASFETFNLTAEANPDALLGHFIPPGEYSGDDLKRLGFFQDEEDLAAIFYVEAVAAGDLDIEFELTLGGLFGEFSEIVYTGSGYMSTDMFTFEPAAQVDIRIDSDKTAAGLPEDDPYQDQIEVLDDSPGKVVLVGDWDGDSDGTLDFYERHQTGSFNIIGLTPVTFTIPRQIYDSVESVAISYESSPPNLDVSTGGYAATGMLRLWTADGEYIPSGSLSETEFTAPCTNSDYFATFYVEAVNVRSYASPIQFDVTLENNDLTLTDVVNVTAVQAYADSAAMSGAVRLADGTVWLSSTDIATAGWDLPWSNTHVITTAPRPGLSNMYGNGVTIAELPRLIQATGSIIAIIGEDTIYFDRTDPADSSSPEYKPRFGRHEQLAVVDTVDDFPQYVLTLPDGGQFMFHTFNPDTPETQRGSIDKYTGPGGVVTQAYYTDGKLSSVVQGENIFYYNYIADGQNEGLLESVEWTTISAGNVQTATYSYYGDGDTFHGPSANLKEVKVTDADDHVIGGAYYRYYRNIGPANSSGYVSQAYIGADYLRLRGAFGDNFYNDSSAVNYATYRFEYDRQTGKVTDQWIQGAGGSITSTSNAQGHFHFDYTSAPTNPDRVGPNVWSRKIEITRPDVGGALGSDSTATLYVNSAGQTMLSKMEVQGQQIATFTQYDNAHRVIMTAAPSAIAAITTNQIEAFADLLNNDGGNYQYLKDEEGLITRMTYHGSDFDGYLESISLLHGETGDLVPQSALEYVARSAERGGYSATIYLPASSAVYRDEAGNDMLTTTMAYADWMDFQPGTIVTTPPIVEESENGSGVANPVIRTYNAFGQLTSTEVYMDDAHQDSSTTTHAYDAQGLLTSTVVDAGGVALTTTITSRDSQGRVTGMTDPMGNATSIEYLQFASGLGTITTPAAGPRIVTHTDTSLGIVYRFALARNSDTLLSMERLFTDLAGRPTRADRYIEVPVGTLDPTVQIAAGASWEIHSKFTYSLFFHDALGRQNKTINAVGTVREDKLDALSRVTESTIGVRNGWAFEAVAPVTVGVNEYDANSNLIRATLKPDGNSDHDRVSVNVYDWRDRLVASKQGDAGEADRVWENVDINRPLTVLEYDNLDQVTLTAILDGDAFEAGYFVNDYGLTLQDSSVLRGLTLTFHDALGRVYRQKQVYVDQNDGDLVDASTGDPGSFENSESLADARARVSNIWYDPRGLAIASGTSGEAMTKTVYDGAARAVTQSIVAANDLTHPYSVAADTVMSQREITYDANSNVILTVSKDRLATATGSGALDASTARVSRQAAWYDAANRLIASADAGTNSFTRPSTAPTASTVTAGIATLLVTRQEYDDAGLVEFMTDARGIVTWNKDYDDAGRLKNRIENYVANATPDSEHTDINRVTIYTYTPLDQVESIRKNNVSAATVGGNPTPTDRIVTFYAYGGTDLNANQFSNDVLTHITNTTHRVDGSSTEYKESFGYNHLGEAIASEDRTKVIHRIERDIVGRIAKDTAEIPLASNVDDAVKQLAYEFDVFSRGTRYLSRATPNTGTIVNEVTRKYDGYGNLIEEFQDQDGAGSTTGDTITYGYDYSGGKSRLSSLEYGDGFAQFYEYASGAIDDHISRVSALTARFGTGLTPQLMETYAYMGVGQLATALRDSTQNWGLTIARDEFARVSGMRWQTSDGNTRLDYQTYQYDEVGNLKDKFIQTASGNWFEHFEYNGLNLPTEHSSRFYNMVLSANSTLKWNQDSLGNRIDTSVVAPKKYGTPDQQRAIASRHEKDRLKNVILNPSEQLIHPDEKDLAKTEYRAEITYDAWGRARKIFFRAADDFSTIAGHYELTYDAMNRLAWQSYSARTDGTTPESRQDIYSYASNLELRHRVKPSGENESTFSESVWSPDGRMVGRLDTSQFIWTTTDAQNRTTGLLQNGTLSVLERFVYDIDGMVRGTSASFVGWGKTIEPYKWTQFAAGKPWINIMDRTSRGLLGFYQSPAGGLYDPQNNSVVVNTPVFSNKTPASSYEYVSDGWMIGSKISATVGTTALTWATAGLSVAISSFLIGAGISYVDARLGGASPSEALDAAWTGGIYAQAFTATLAILPAAATPYVIGGASVYGGYTAYDSFSQGHYAQGTFRSMLAITGAARFPAFRKFAGDLGEGAYNATTGIARDLGIPKLYGAIRGSMQWRLPAYAYAGHGAPAMGLPSSWASSALMRSLGVFASSALSSYVASLPAGFSNTKLGQAAHDQFLKALMDQTGTRPDDWIMRTKPGETGVDATYLGSKPIGFRYAELKPHSRGGALAFLDQITRWVLPKGETQLWYYDKNGIIGYSGWAFR